MHYLVFENWTAQGFEVITVAVDIVSRTILSTYPVPSRSLTLAQLSSPTYFVRVQNV